jgi:hypothetical protein
MKRLMIILGMLMIIASTNAQSISNYVISPAGEQTYTIGETIISSNENLLAGFQQPIVNPLVNLLKTNDDRLTIYPNPVVNNLNIVSLELCDYKVFDVNGILVLSGKGQSIDMTNQLSGIYIININNQIYRIVKQ